MPIRSFTLEEWFLDLQLRTVRDDHLHLPFTLDVPAAALLTPWRDAGLTPSVPALLVRTTALVAAHHPEVNRLVFRTPLGPRVLEPATRDVNVPVLLDHHGRRLLTAVVVRDADARTVEDIHAQLRAAREVDPTTLPINRLFLDGRDTLARRLQLRAAWFASYRLPWLYERYRGGGLAVSSIYHHGGDALLTRGVSYGPTALTVLAVTRTGAGPDERLHLGVAFDHCALTGDQIGRALRTLRDLLADPVGAGLTPTG